MISLESGKGSTDNLEICDPFQVSGCFTTEFSEVGVLHLAH